MTSLNDVIAGRRDDGAVRCPASCVGRLLSGVLRSFIGALAVLYAAKMAAIFTAHQLTPATDADRPVAAADDVISTVTGSDVSRLLSDAETPRQRELWTAASRRSTTDYDRRQLVDDRADTVRDRSLETEITVSRLRPQSRPRRQTFGLGLDAGSVVSDFSLDAEISVSDCVDANTVVVSPRVWSPPRSRSGQFGLGLGVGLKCSVVFDTTGRRWRLERGHDCTAQQTTCQVAARHVCLSERAASWSTTRTWRSRG